MIATVLPTDAPKDITWSVQQAGDTGTTMTGRAEITIMEVLTAISNGTVKVRATI